jgi:hypothetical protein
MKFFNQSAVETNSQEFPPPCAQKNLDTADIVRDVRKVGISYKWILRDQMSE